MFYLQKAKIQNANQWLVLIQQSRIELELWLPHLKNLITIEQAQEYIHRNASLDFYLGAHLYEIWAEEELVGLISLHSGRVTNQTVQLAYWLGSAYVGKGYATKACQVLASKTFVEHPIQKLYIHCLRSNLPSRKLAVRLGFDLVKEENRVLHFVMLRKQWFADYYEEDHLFDFLEEISY